MSSSSDTNLIAATQYDIYSKLLFIASKYTDITNEDFLRSGLFGYVTESMALILRDSSIHKTMLYNESFLNTAIIPKSVYNWAKMFNINVNSATPAYANITITISEDDFNNYSKAASSYDSDTYGSEITSYGDDPILIIDKGNNFIAGTYNFMLEHSVLLKSNGENNGYIAKYLDEETNETTNYQNYSSPLLTTTFYTDSYGEAYISIECRVYQYAIATKTKIIATSSYIDRKIHEFEFSDQFVSATCTYTKNTTQNVELFYSNISDVSDSSIYAYYSLNDSNTLQIKFPDGTGTFKPATNSTLEVKIITTLGSSGNISYTGDVICRLNDEDLRNLSLSISFSDQQSTGGVDAPSLSEIKQTIINQISTRDVIVTESDLNSYFEVLRSLLETVNKGEVKFVKKRDDILRRVFTAYILMKDIESDSSYLPADIPTNTVNVDCILTANTDVKFGAEVIQSGSQFILNNAASIKTLLSGKSSTAIYLVPFYMYVSLSPIRRVKYIYNLCSDSSALSYSSVTANSGTNIIVPSSVKVYRGFDSSAIDEAYTFTFTFTTNFQMTDASSGSSGSLDLYFMSKSNGVTISSSTLSYSTDDTHVEIESGDIDEDTGTCITTIKITIPTASTEFNFASNASLTADYGAYINLNPGLTSVSTISLPEDVTPVLTFNNITTNSATLSMSFKADETLTLFQNLDDIMSSDITVNYDTDGNISSFTIKDVPVLNEDFLEDEDSSSDKLDNFITQLFIYINMLKENLDKLETNTFFDLKFYNTSGLSQYYNTHNVDLDLQLRIRLKSTLSPSSYASDIRKYIRSLVSEANDESTLKISHILASTVTKFYNYIESIDFEGLNGTFTQYIKPITYSSSDSYKKLSLTPEHFNIPDKYLDDIIITDYDEISGVGTGYDT